MSVHILVYRLLWWWVNSFIGEERRGGGVQGANRLTAAM